MIRPKQFHPNSTANSTANSISLRSPRGGNPEQDSVVLGSGPDQLAAQLDRLKTLAISNLQRDYRLKIELHQQLDQLDHQIADNEALLARLDPQAGPAPAEGSASDSGLGLERVFQNTAPIISELRQSNPQVEQLFQKLDGQLGGVLGKLFSPPTTSAATSPMLDPQGSIQ